MYQNIWYELYGILFRIIIDTRALTFNHDANIARLQIGNSLAPKIILNMLLHSISKEIFFKNYYVSRNAGQMLKPESLLRFCLNLIASVHSEFMYDMSLFFRNFSAS